MKIIDLFENKLDIKFDEMVDLIKRDCQPFLSQCNGELLFRGLRNTHDSYIKKSVRTDRKPLSTKLEIHQIVDKWFNKNFKFNARSEAIFASGSFSLATSYGKAFIVFPIGDFKYVWSENIEDLFMDLSFLLNKKDKSDKSDTEQIEDLLNQSNYKDTDLDQALLTDTEIMIKCEDYYAVRVNMSEIGLWKSVLF